MRMGGGYAYAEQWKIKYPNYTSTSSRLIKIHITKSTEKLSKRNSSGNIQAKKFNSTVANTKTFASILNNIFMKQLANENMPK